MPGSYRVEASHPTMNFLTVNFIDNKPNSFFIES